MNPQNNYGVVHFAIEADDVDRARAFYEGVFGWRFEAWGPPGFYRVLSGTAEVPGIEGALYARAVPRRGDDAMVGYRCTIGVPDLDATTAAVVANGATIRTERSTIPGVGSLIEFADPEGNIVCAMQYE
ncbi:MAG: VOC family protein [Dehalococcoidia bacterium]|nr:VOC family protein [Dehalococcoidia bacterium]